MNLLATMGRPSFSRMCGNSSKLEVIHDGSCFLSVVSVLLGGGLLPVTDITPERLRVIE